MPPPLLVCFAGGSVGPWQIDRIDTVAGDGLPGAERLAIVESGGESEACKPVWRLRGSTSNARYSGRDELDHLADRQAGLGRPGATCAALIPIRKNEAWWSLAQDERRDIFEEQSHHIAIGLETLPAVARRLHHGRELGEPFDFLTWFDYAPEQRVAFERMVDRLRASPEWRYVEREVDIRLTWSPDDGVGYRNATSTIS